MATDPREPQTPQPPSADAKVERDAELTYPASDPVGYAAQQGARAVPPQEMMDEAGGRPAPADDAVTLSLRFPDGEAAKLALEAAVREGPIGRRCATIDLGDNRVTMRLEVPRTDRERVDGLLRKHGAMEA